MESLANKVKDTLNLTQPQVTLPSSFHQHEVTHAATSNAATWKEALATSTSIPKNAVLTKTLVFKPKVAKSQASVLIVVVALDNTVTNAAQVAKAAHEKEARFATADAVKEALDVTVEQGNSSDLWD
jgi:prolyl-tRNA editing enzyme YbaK/EbsC (Cys-tRNA(Pro) deacylase)